MYSRLTLKLAVAALLLPVAPFLSAQTAATQAAQAAQDQSGPQSISPAPPVTLTPQPAPQLAPSSQTVPTTTPSSNTAPVTQATPDNQGPQATPAAQAAPASASPATPAPIAATPSTPNAAAPGTTATTGSLRGRAVDATNAVIPGTTVSLIADGGKIYTTQSTGDGTYLLPNVPPGTYTVSTQVNGFQAYTHPGIKITAATATRLNLHLQLEINTVVNVKADTGQQLNVSSDSNASTLVLTGKDLDALSDDPDELSDELNALAGPAAGPNGGQIYIDGFTGGQLPPKSSIREIRINQNPFSAQYDKIGYGRIEVFTKPGTDKLHGSFQLSGNSNSFNTAALVGNTYQPPYHSLLFQGSLSGPLSKHASYNIGSNYRQIQDNNVVNTTIAPGPTFTPTNHFIQAIFFPQTRFDISPRLDLQISPTNTLTSRYQFDHTSATNAGTGNNSLATAGYNTSEDSHEIQLSDSQNIGARMVTETRFEFSRDASTTTAQNPQQTTSIQGAFTDFGNGTGLQSDTASHYELQSYTSLALASHFLRFGGRLRVNQDSNSSTSGFYGTFSYGQKQVLVSSNSTTYLNATGNSADCPTNATSVPADPLNPSGPQISVYFVSGICNYSITQLHPGPASDLNSAYASGFGPIQFTANFGNPAISVTTADLGIYAEDDWKARPNLTLSLGVRYETQNHISDHHDFAPRFSMGWGLGKRNGAPLFVVRGGFGIFYDRYSISQVQTVERLNGLNQQQVTISNPNPTTCGPTTIIGPDTTPTATCIHSPSPGSAITYAQAPGLRTPYTMQTGGSIEHQLFKPLTLTLTYLNSRGNHQFFTQNAARSAGAAIGAPNVYQYVSEGVFKQNQLIVQGTFRGPAGTSLFGYYTFSHANSNTSSASSFPSNSIVDPNTHALLVPNDITADYGRAGFDTHHKLFFGGSAPLPYHIAVSPFLIATSGAPFNITLGSDINTDTILNDRPAFASAANCTAAAANPTANPNIVVSKYGCFDKGTTVGQQRIPVNYGQGSAQVTFNMRLTKTFGFGKYLRGAPDGGSSGHHHDHSGGGLASAGSGSGRGGGHSSGGDMGFGGGGTSTGRRYNLTIGAQGSNLFNVVNYGVPVGVISSPQFGQQTKLSTGIFSTNTAVRRISLQASFTF